MKQFGLFLLEKGMEERQVDIMRQVLWEQPEFDPFTCFRYLSSTNSDGWIQHKNISLFLKKHKIVHNKFESICLVKALDQNNDGVIGYSDFLNFVKPDFSTQTIENYSSAVKDKNELHADVEYALLRLIQRELEFHRKIEGWKEQMIQQKEWLQEAFFYILPKDSTKPTFGLKNLKNFMIFECGFDLIDEELNAIFRRLDRNLDGKVTCEEFSFVVLPLHIDKQEQINWMLRHMEK